MLDFRHTNSLWATVAVETLVRLGLTMAVISPGSRSTPLTLAFVSHPQVEAIPILDERSASFFALGRAKATGVAVVLICTSGTAGANYFPAVIEAWESQVPLLILTADRPPELRHCSSGQTIDQQKLFGAYVNGYAELGLPEATPSALAYLRQTFHHRWQQAHEPIRGPVHLNCPFQDPLAPTVDPTVTALEASWDNIFFDHLHPLEPPQRRLQTLPPALAMTERGVIIAGPAQPVDAVAYCQDIAALSKALGWPVLAEGLSPLRNYGALNPGLVTTYAALLRQPQLAKALAPEQVLQMGPLPTSKVLRQWLTDTDPLRWVIGRGDRNGDPLHGRTRSLGDISLGKLTTMISTQGSHLDQPDQPSPYWQAWLQGDAIARRRLDQALATLDSPFAGKVPWLMAQVLPENTPVFIANSTPVRDVEWFWPVTDRGIKPGLNRGANGIDGTLSTALGMAHGGQSSVVLTGDLALLHDSNGFLITPQFRGHLTIVLINNQGGGIFEMLPISQFEPPFETFFATPQAVDFETLCAAHGVTYGAIHNWTQLAERLAVLPSSGIRLLEVRSDRKQDAQQRLTLLNDAFPE